jgi:hypothetical protein
VTKKKKFAKMSVMRYTPSNIKKFRDEWIKKGFELVDITQLCEFKLGRSGSINEFNEPNEECYHIQVHYRDECIANFDGTNFYPIDDDKHIIYVEKCLTCKTPDDDFVVFRKVRL